MGFPDIVAGHDEVYQIATGGKAMRNSEEKLADFEFSLWDTFTDICKRAYMQTCTSVMGCQKKEPAGHPISLGPVLSLGKTVKCSETLHFTPKKSTGDFDVTLMFAMAYNCFSENLRRGKESVSQLATRSRRLFIYFYSRRT